MVATLLQGGLCLLLPLERHLGWGEEVVCPGKLCAGKGALGTWLERPCRGALLPPAL